MKVLCIDNESMALDWLIRCQDAGHEVMWFQRPRKGDEELLVGEGFLKRTSDLEALRKKWLGWADLIFLTDNSVYIDLLEPYRKIGYPIFGCNAEAAELELDREAGQRAFKECGLNVIPSKFFSDYDSAIRYVEKLGKPCVSKVSGDADKALSFVANDAAGMCHKLEKWKKNSHRRHDAKKHGFVIQEKIIGCEMAVGGWFGPGGWSEWFLENWEYKKLMDGDLGVNTGEQGTLARYVKKSKLAAQVLLPLTKMLERMQYVGYVDVNCIINALGVWPMEFTMRPGWPTFHNQMALHLGDPVQWMADLLDGFDTLKVSTDLSVSIVLTTPPYPYPRQSSADVVGVPIYGAGDKQHVRFVEVMMTECPVQVGDKVMRLPNPATAGDYVLVVTGTGQTISGARRSAYAAMRKIDLPNSPSYRLDIGAGRLIRQLPDLQKLGYATGLEL